MRELTSCEINPVSGGSLAGNIAMGLAGGWAGTVAGFAAGPMFPGAGNLAGAAVGFVVGAGTTVDYALATSDGGSEEA